MVTSHPLLEALDTIRRDTLDARERAILRHIRHVRDRALRRPPLGNWIRVSSIAEPLGHFLFALVRAARPEVCVELGTGAGISTMYLVAALALNRRGALWSLDGNDTLLALARRHIATLPLQAPCRFIHGPHDRTVAQTLRQLRRIDFAFVDGDHTQQATLRQFVWLRRALRPGSILVYDDIRWSVGMQRAWRHIQRQSPVGTTMDCDRFGLVLANGHAT